MSRMRVVLLLALVALVALVGCKKEVEPPKQIDAFTCDTMERLIGTDQATVDTEEPAEGKGSLMMVSDQQKTVALFKVNDPGAGGAKFLVQFKMKVQNFNGDVYGQMVLGFESGGTQTIDNRECCRIGADSDWLPMTLVWEVKDKSKKVSSLSINAVLAGDGTAWVDDVKVTRVPLS